MDKSPLRQIAEIIIENLEQMDLPKVNHNARELMISEVEATLRGTLTERGFVQIEAMSDSKPAPQTGDAGKSKMAETHALKLEVMAQKLRLKAGFERDWAKRPRVRKKAECEQTALRYEADAIIFEAGAAALRAQGRETGQWLPIETAPKDGTVIDIWCVSSDSVDRWRETNCIWRHDRGLWSNGNGMWDCATHWSLLLPPVSTESALTSPPVTQK